MREREREREKEKEREGKREGGEERERGGSKGDDGGVSKMSHCRWATFQGRRWSGGQGRKRRERGKEDEIKKSERGGGGDRWGEIEVEQEEGRER